MFLELLACIERRDPKAALAGIDAILAGERATDRTRAKSVSRSSPAKAAARGSARPAEMLVPKKRAFE
jgi:hypothetical protein